MANMAMALNTAEMQERMELSTRMWLHAMHPCHKQMYRWRPLTGVHRTPCAAAIGFQPSPASGASPARVPLASMASRAAGSAFNGE